MLQYTQRTAPFHHGNEFKLDCVLQDNGSPVAIPKGTQISCAVRTDTGDTISVADLTVANQATNAGEFTLSIKDTSRFPVGVNVFTVVVFDLDDQLYASVTLITPVI